MKSAWLILVSLISLLTGCTDDVKPQRQLTANPASIGFLDAPAAEAAVDPIFTVAGWAIDESGVQRVRIYVDDTLIATVPLTVPRPDLDRLYPRVAQPGTPHGFTVVIDVGDSLGFRRLRLEAIDGRGAATHVAAANVKIGWS
jgi:hypothetical protein